MIVFGLGLEYPCLQVDADVRGQGLWADIAYAQDDVPQEVKARRLNEVIAAFRARQAALNQAEIGRMHLVRLTPDCAAKCQIAEACHFEAML